MNPATYKDREHGPSHSDEKERHVKMNSHKLLRFFVEGALASFLGIHAVAPGWAQAGGPYVPPPSDVEIRPLTNVQPVTVSVSVFFPQPAPCYYVTNWGQVVVEGTFISVDAQFWTVNTACPDRVSGASTQYPLGLLSPGDYTLAFSVWGTLLQTVPFSVPPPRLPLNIATAGGQVQLSWPTNPPGYVLESSADLPSPGWSVVTNTPAVSGPDFTVNVDLASGQKFFRLHHP